jgi:hypothetical protein
VAKPRSPFDVALTDDQRKTLGLWLSYELENGLAARSAQAVEVDYWHALYEQARTRTRNLPWPDAADLTSYIPCEQVDSIHARMMRTVWTEPLCTVSGYGTGADRAPFVEEFHQWKVEEEGLQTVLDKLFLMGLIEPRGLLEVSESSATLMTRKTMHAKLKLDELSGGPVFDDKGQPQFETDAQGKFIDAGPEDPAAQTVVDSPDTVRTGPQYRILPYRDSLILPGHARDDQEIWGYAKRIWKRKRDLQADAAAGVYDKTAVDALTDTTDREPDQALQRSLMDVPPARAETAEKELWEVLWLIDLNALLESHGQPTLKDKTFSGARWYVATVHLQTHNLLRLNHDDLDQSRFVPMILFPRPDRATEGFSFVGHKLITVTEEHTAYRNMAADCCSRAVNSPIMRVSGALWDPDEQPLGPKQVIDVRNPNEVSALELPDVPQSLFIQIQGAENAGRRIGGINDVAAGQQVEKGNPTLGEIQMATEQSFVRMDLIVRRAQKALESIMQIRHAIWKRVLAEQPTGVEVPESLTVGLEVRGTSIDRYMPDGKITAALLDGAFRFKPYGSVETANLAEQRNGWVAMMQALPMLLKIAPSMAMNFQNPAASRALAREFFRVFRVANTQAFLGQPSQDLLGMGGAMPGQQVAMQGQPMAPPMPGMPMGMPQGAPGQAVMAPPMMPSPLMPQPGMLQ